MIQDVITKGSEPKKVSHTLLEDLITGQEEMIVELQKLNKNLVIVGQALIKMAEKPVKPPKAKKMPPGANCPKVNV